MKFIADLHVHSRFSRATAKNLDLENLFISACLKGITLVGTGDFTHPGWFSEIQEKLIPAEPGLFRLRPEIAAECDKLVPLSCRGDVRFILQCEISNIYKKNGKTRKNHHLIFVPDFETASRFNSKMEVIGNIRSDGRPILGLDAKILLKILLETSDESFLIPAHLWTPWFSVLGSKSGFDSLEECFEELVPEIFAIETGLSSDPPMNRRVSSLDRVTLVSNSDAHSPGNLGRNANIFDTELSYFAIKSALKTADPAQCLGTLDMYPEEGKYHTDGHRKCNVCLHPSETLKCGGICPKCGKPLTLGVLYRVEELADRLRGEKSERDLPFYHIIPLTEILSELFNTGTGSKKVGNYYHSVLEILGPEINILQSCSLEQIDAAGIPLLGEAIRRMRSGQVHISPGYDGEYGKITLFECEEKERLLGQRALFCRVGETHRGLGSDDTASDKETVGLTHPTAADSGISTADIVTLMNAEQREAVEHESGPLLIIAGPGAGKTMTLTHRIAYLIKNRNISPENILAVTFTDKAAREMRDRLKSLLISSPDSVLPRVATFHALCFQILKDEGNPDYAVIDDDERKAFLSEAIRAVKQKGISLSLKPDVLSDKIVSAKQNILSPGEIEEADFIKKVYETYQALLAQECRYDYEDLIFNVVKLFESDAEIREKYSGRFRYIFVDEYQDLNQGQYRIIKALSPYDKDLCVIGDPDQSIYGFRGSDVSYFQKFTQDYPESKVIRLTRNYRSAESILEASHQVIRKHSISPAGTRVYSNIKGIKTLTILELPTEKAEAVAVGKIVESLVGGTGFHSVDFGKTDESGIKSDRSFSDFAVLYRTHAQSQIFSEIFDQAGIPCQIANRDIAYNQKGIAELVSFLKITEDSGIFNDFRKIIGTERSITKKAFEIFGTWFYQSRMTIAQALSAPGQIALPNIDAKMQSKFCDFADNFSEMKKKLAGKTVGEKLMFLSEHTGLSEKIKENRNSTEAFNMLLRTAKAFGANSADFFAMIALRNHDADIHDINAEKVTLMTLHASKGLEFPVVFIAGCEKDFIPFSRPDKKTDTDEERRLFYVAMTRAKEQLFLTHVKTRTVYGKTLAREISPFVSDIEQRLIRVQKSQFKKKEKKHSQTQLDLF